MRFPLRQAELGAVLAHLDSLPHDVVDPGALLSAGSTHKVILFPVELVQLQFNLFFIKGFAQQGASFLARPNPLHRTRDLLLPDVVFKCHSHEWIKFLNLPVFSALNFADLPLQVVHRLLFGLAASSFLTNLGNV